MIATMRNPDKETELATLPGVVLFPLDITDHQQIERAATRAVTLGGVDVVFNNAGYGMSGPLEGLTDEQMLRMVNTNHRVLVHSIDVMCQPRSNARSGTDDHVCWHSASGRAVSWSARPLALRRRQRSFAGWCRRFLPRLITWSWSTIARESK
jgi:NAD(P)-dependent dehydrogenase (short-subunit alcohol dehydrogenase family)